MPQFSLRTLMVVMLLGYPLLLAVLWWWGESILPSLDRAFAWFGISCAVAIGLASVVHTIRTMFCWPKAPAIIVRYWIIRSEGQPDGQPFYHPVIRFKPLDSKPILAISNCGSWDHPWREGESVMVRYNPQDPQIFRINCFSQNWGLGMLSLALAAMGITFLYFGH